MSEHLVDEIVEQVLENEQPEGAPLSVEQIVEIVHEVECGPVRFSAWALEGGVDVLIASLHCQSQVVYFRPDQFSSVGEVVDELQSQAERFLGEQLTYKGRVVNFVEAYDEEGERPA